MNNNNNPIIQLPDDMNQQEHSGIQEPQQNRSQDPRYLMVPMPTVHCQYPSRTLDSQLKADQKTEQGLNGQSSGQSGGQPVKGSRDQELGPNDQDSAKSRNQTNGDADLVRNSNQQADQGSNGLLMNQAADQMAKGCGGQMMNVDQTAAPGSNGQSMRQNGGGRANECDGPMVTSDQMNDHEPEGSSLNQKSVQSAKRCVDPPNQLTDQESDGLPIDPLADQPDYGCGNQEMDSKYRGLNGQSMNPGIGQQLDENSGPETNTAQQTEQSLENQNGDHVAIQPDQHMGNQDVNGYGDAQQGSQPAPNGQYIVPTSSQPVNGYVELQYQQQPGPNGQYMMNGQQGNGYGVQMVYPYQPLDQGSNGQYIGQMSGQQAVGYVGPVMYTSQQGQNGQYMIPIGGQPSNGYVGAPQYPQQQQYAVPQIMGPNQQMSHNTNNQMMGPTQAMIQYPNGQQMVPVAAQQGNGYVGPVMNSNNQGPHVQYMSEMPANGYIAPQFQQQQPPNYYEGQPMIYSNQQNGQNMNQMPGPQYPQPMNQNQVQYNNQMAPRPMMNAPMIQIQGPDGNFINQQHGYGPLQIQHHHKDQLLASNQGLLHIDPKIADNLTLAYQVKTEDGVVHFPQCFQEVRHNRHQFAPTNNYRFEGRPMYKNYHAFSHTSNSYLRRLNRLRNETFWNAPTQFLGYTMKHFEIARRKFQKIRDPCVKIAMTYLPWYCVLEDTIDPEDLLMCWDENDLNGRFFGQVDPNGPYDEYGRSRDWSRIPRHRSYREQKLLPSPKVEEISEDASVATPTENKEVAVVQSSSDSAPLETAVIEIPKTVSVNKESEETTHQGEVEDSKVQVVEDSKAPVVATKNPKKEWFHKRYRKASWKKENLPNQEEAGPSQPPNPLEMFEDSTPDLFRDPTQLVKKQERKTRFKKRTVHDKNLKKIVRNAEKAQAERVAELAGKAKVDKISDFLDMMKDTLVSASAKKQEKKTANKSEDKKTPVAADLTVSLSVPSGTENHAETIADLIEAVEDSIVALAVPLTSLVVTVEVPMSPVKSTAVLIRGKAHPDVKKELAKAAKGSPRKQSKAKLSYAQIANKSVVAVPKVSPNPVADSLEVSTVSLESLSAKSKDDSRSSQAVTTEIISNPADSIVSPVTESEDGSSSPVTDPVAISFESLSDTIGSPAHESEEEPSFPKVITLVATRPFAWKTVGVYTPPEVMVVQQQKQEPYMSKIKGFPALGRRQSSSSQDSGVDFKAIAIVGAAEGPVLTPADDASSSSLPVAGKLRKALYKKKIAKEDILKLTNFQL